MTDSGRRVSEVHDRMLETIQLGFVQRGENPPADLIRVVVDPIITFVSQLMVQLEELAKRMDGLPAQMAAGVSCQAGHEFHVKGDLMYCRRCGEVRGE